MKRAIRFSPLLLVVALSPALFQTAYSCERGDTYLLQLEFEAYGQNRVVGFNPNNRDYALFNSSATAIVRTLSRDPLSTVTYQWLVNGVSVEAGQIGVGGGDVALNVPPGQSTLRVSVRAAPPEAAVGAYLIEINPPCSPGPGECDDGSACTTDLCDTLTSTCEFTELPDGAVCDFSAVGDGVCMAGACESALGTLMIDAEFNLCAELIAPAVSSSQALVGQSIALTAQATDEEGDTIAYLWTATGGAIGDQNAAATTYTCEVEGAHMISLEISDDGFNGCIEGWSTIVVCEDAGLCAGVDCDDADLCTDDSCDPATGCGYTPVVCDDFDACTADSCDSVTGCANDPIACDDGNVCTTNTCDPASGCAFAPIPNCCVIDADCPAGDFCNAQGFCETPVIECPCFTAEELAYNRPYDNCLDWDPTSQYGPGLYVNRDQVLIGGKTATMKAFTQKPPYAPGLACNFQGCGLDGWCNYTRAAYESNGDLTLDEWNVCTALLEAELANASLTCQICTSYGCN